VRTLAVAVVALAAVPAASAKPAPLPGFRVIFPHTFVLAQAPQRPDRQHSCAVGDRRSRVRLPGPKPVGDMARKAVVACEQPPRSRVSISADGAVHAFNP
jgi:hypothetical protein